MLCSEELDLKVFSAEIRLNILKMLTHKTYGHLGGSLSIVEILAVLYKKYLKHNPKNPRWNERDFLVLSKGHAGPALYTTLALRGFFPLELLKTLNDNGTSLPSHPDRLKTPGVDATTGSLGQGTSVAAGLAYGSRLLGTKQKIYLITGDGELNEGQCWEAFQFIAANKLNEVLVIIDENKRQLDGYTKDILYPFDIQKKMESFGFTTQKVKGNDVMAISESIESLNNIKNSATCLILDTIKGQGVKYFEDMLDNHSVKFTENDYREANSAILELEKFISKGGL